MVHAGGIILPRVSSRRNSMLWLTRLLSRVLEILISVPAFAFRFLFGSVAFNPRLGWVQIGRAHV